MTDLGKSMECGCCRAPGNKLLDGLIGAAVAVVSLSLSWLWESMFGKSEYRLLLEEINAEMDETIRLLRIIAEAPEGQDGPA